MIHKKGGRIRTYGRPAPALLGWVAGLGPLVASVPEIDALRYRKLLATRFYARPAAYPIGLEASYLSPISPGTLKGDSYQMICVNFAPFQSGIPALFCNLFSAIYNRFSALLNGSKGSLRSGFSSYNRSPSRASLCRSFTAFSSSKWHSPYDI
ncbi:hypothetical protein MRB53_036543 [Persea americana]|nr:hypothetical protein MRB53_037485 [Persea americana]KAJ8613864.1 hypothetical protein MRB53_036821 [Persea americana]KAJ8614677.1 hypothetical protein MRB53_036543 [Persea americana]